MTERLLLAQLSVDVRSLEKSLQKAGLVVDNTSRKMERSWNSATQKMTRDTEQFGRDAARAIAAIGIAAAVSEVTSLSDAWVEAGNQIASASAATGTAAISLSRVADIARSTRTEFDATVSLYARLTRATADLGASQEQVVRATTLINQAFVAGGASAQEQASSILQLSQALQSGVLQGEELKALRENSPLLIAAIANEFNVAAGALKDLGAEGKLTSDRVFQAILRAAPQIEAQFSVTESTVAQAINNVRTAATEYAGTTAKALGISSSLTGVINALADNFEVFADSVLIAVTLLGARGLGGALNSAAVNIGGFVKSFGTGNAEYIRGLEHARDVAVKAASDASHAREAEVETLRRLEKERTAAASTIFTSDASIVQQRKLRAAQDELTASTAALNRLLASKTATSDAVTQATIRQTIAQGNLNALERARGPELDALVRLDAQHAATTQRLAVATEDLNKKRHLATLATRELTTAQNALGRAGNSLMAFFGGPIGLAITAVGGAFAYYQHKAMLAERATRSLENALDILSRADLANPMQINAAADSWNKMGVEIMRSAEAAKALEAIQARRMRNDFVEAIEGQKRAVRALREEMEYLEKRDFSPENMAKYFTQTDAQMSESLTNVRAELAETERYVAILESGLKSLEAVDFKMKPATADLPAPIVETADEKGLKAAERAARAKIDLERDAARDITSAWRQATETRVATIKRELTEARAAIDAITDASINKEALRTKALEIYQAQMAEVYAAEEAKAKAAHDAAILQEKQEEAYVYNAIAAREQMFGHWVTLSAMEYAARKADIEANIKDEERRFAALAALAAEKAEADRLARQEIFRLDERSDPQFAVGQVREIEAIKLEELRDALENKLITLQEYADLEKAIAADTAAEIMDIQAQARLSQLSTAESMFGSLSQLAETFAGKSSALYKTLFLAEKGAALASAWINMQLAVAKANAAAPPPLNAPLIAAARLQGMAAIAGIAASTISGFKSGGYTGDGPDNEVAGRVHRGEYVFTKAQTRKIGVQNLQALATGATRGPPTVPVGARPAVSGSFSFGDTNISISGNGADEIRNELESTLARHRRDTIAAVRGEMPRVIAAEGRRSTPRHERKRL